MIALYLIAAHLVGDFVLQSRWMAAEKLTDARVRARHVAWYCVPFVPVAFLCARYGVCGGFVFLAVLAVLHFLTDSRRFLSSLGDVIEWWIDWRPFDPELTPNLTPNPWTPLPIVIDQTLHVCQLALLAGLLLR